MYAAYAPGYFVELGDAHRFPMRKYPLVHRTLTGEGTLRRGRIFEPCEASAEDLLLVHTPDYLERLFRGLLSPTEQRRLGFPWPPAGRSRPPAAPCRMGSPPTWPEVPTTPSRTTARATAP